MKAESGRSPTRRTSRPSRTPSSRCARWTRPARGQPVQRGRQGRDQQGQEDRLHLGHARPRARATSPRRRPRTSSTPTDPAADAGLKVATGGYLGQAVSKADTESSEAIGLAAAVVILLFAFGTVTAMILPIVTAVLGLVASLAIIKLLGHVVDVPTRRAHARDDDRPRRRDRLRAVHRHPPQAAAARTGWRCASRSRARRPRRAVRSCSRASRW